MGFLHPHHLEQQQMSAGCRHNIWLISHIFVYDSLNWRKCHLISGLKQNWKTWMVSPPKLSWWMPELVMLYQRELNPRLHLMWWYWRAAVELTWRLTLTRETGRSMWSSLEKEESLYWLEVWRWHWRKGKVVLTLIFALQTTPALLRARNFDWVWRTFLNFQSKGQ